MRHLSGDPLTSSTTADNDQPVSSRKLDEGFGNRTIGASTIRCGESKLLMLYSASTS